MIDGKDWVRTMGAAVKAAQQDLLDHGIPITYRDTNGVIVRRFPDGRTEVVNGLLPDRLSAAE
jgi:hypothetical protein